MKTSTNENGMNLLADWKTIGREKIAAMTAVNDADVEKAFADQASGFVENKLGPLMQDQYRLGFEIVKANEENTRICGVFAFKVDKDLIFAPVFFINGTIKGPLIYRCDKKTFVPANKEFANYLIENIEMHSGSGVDMTERSKNPPLVQMQRVLMPPNALRKSAARKVLKKNTIDAADKEDIRKSMEADGMDSKLTPQEYRSEYAKRFNKKYGKKYVEKEASEKITDRIVQEVNVPSCTCRLHACSEDCEEKDPAQVEQGTFKVKNFNEKYNVPGKLSNGECVLKVAAWDDGTIRIGDYMLTQNDGRNIAKEAAFSIDVPGVATFDIPAEGASLLKSAYLRHVPDFTETWTESMFEGIDRLENSKGILREFLADKEYGKAAVDAIVKAASGDEGYAFAEKLATAYPDPKDLLDLAEESLAKVAYEAKEPENLKIIFSPEVLKRNIGNVPERFWKDGFFIQDARPADTMSVVYQDTPDQLSFPKEVGVYSVLKENGEFLDKVLIGRVAHRDVGFSHYNGWRHDMGAEDLAGDGDWDHESNHYILVHDGKARYSHGVMCVQTGPPSEYPGATNKVEEKKLYFIYVPGQAGLIGPIAVDDVYSEDGVQFASGWGLNNKSGHGHDAIWDGEAPEVRTNANELEDFTVNPHLEKSNVNEAVFGKDAVFIPLDRDVSKFFHAFGQNWAESVQVLKEQLGNTKNINNWVFNRFGVAKATIHSGDPISTEDGSTKQASWYIDNGVKYGPNLPKSTMMIKLTRDMGLPANTAYDLLEKAASCEDGVTFMFEPGEMYKEATRYRLIDAPQFKDEFSSEFGVPMQPTQEFHLKVQGDQIQEQPSTIGDMLNPTTATGLPNLTVVTTDPNQLRSLADIYNLPNVFEHGVVGTLANTFDAMRLVDQYLPRIEQGLDAIGRIKFLLHWCPTDFEKTYGADDMTNFEAEVDSCFEAYGALFLKLAKQSDKQKKGGAKLMGDEVTE